MRPEKDAHRDRTPDLGDGRGARGHVLDPPDRRVSCGMNEVAHHLDGGVQRLDRQQKRPQQHEDRDLGRRQAQQGTQNRERDHDHDAKT